MLFIVIFAEFPSQDRITWVTVSRSIAIFLNLSCKTVVVIEIETE